MSDIITGEARLTRREQIRIISLWLAIMALVICTYQLGQWNATNIINEVHTFCGNVPVNVGLLGDVIISKNVSSVIPLIT